MIVGRCLRASSFGFSLLTFWTLLALVPASASSSELTLEQANRRWAGAKGTLLIPIKLRTRQEKNGWTSGWFQTVPGPYTTHPITGKTKCRACANGELPFSYLLSVSDLDALRRTLDNNHLPVGTVFLIDGWRRLNSGGGFFLEMRIPSFGVRARFFFAMTYKDLERGLSMERFSQIEQYMRIQMLDLERRDEHLVPLAAIPTNETPPSARLQVQRSGEQLSFKPAVRVEAVSVKPPRLAPGDEVEVLVTFTLEGLPPGSSFEIVIEHQIWQGERQLASLPETLSYPAGTHTNARTLRSDPEQPPGLYTLRTRLGFAGIVDTGSALFEVAATP